MSDSTGTLAFTYYANGMHTKKVKTNASGMVTDTYTYVYNGSQLSQMTKNGQVLNFFYDGEGRPAYFTHNNTTYYYVTNLQGDVIAILDSTGTMVVNYHYDAYGVLLQTGGTMATTLGTLNPLTYRGYVYDHETGLYYLQSRYYNPVIKRFISADGQIAGVGGDVSGYDLFEYCFNNPVNMYDDEGTWPKWIERAAKIVTAAVAVTAAVVMVATVSAVSCGTAAPGALVGASMFLGAALSGINGGIANEKNGNSYINGYIGGAVGGTIQAACSQTPVGVIAGGGAGVFAGTIITDTLNNIDPYSKNSTAKEVVANATLSAGKAFITSSLTAFMNYTSDLAVSSRGDGLMQSFTFGFGEAVKSFFGWLDDALVYLLE